jgi:hypothetical protein
MLSQKAYYPGRHAANKTAMTAILFREEKGARFGHIAVNQKIGPGCDIVLWYLRNFRPLIVFF